MEEVTATRCRCSRQVQQAGCSCSRQAGPFVESQAVLLVLQAGAAGRCIRQFCRCRRQVAVGALKPAPLGAAALVVSPLVVG